MANRAPRDVQAPTSAAASPERDLAGALHEVSNALTVVVGWLERAKESVGEDGDTARAIAIASARAADARAIARRAIGADVRIEATGTVGRAAQDAALGVEPVARRAGARVELDVDPDAARASVPDPSKVVQILTNLLLNAIAVSEVEGTIRLEGRRGEGATVAFGVEDQGPGIAVERRATLFSAGETTTAGGAGIGLRHAAALAAASGGALALGDPPSSDVERPGARFELSWPLVRSRPSRPPPPPASRPRPELEGARILLVEDDAAVLELLDTALTARGAEVVRVREHGDLSKALTEGPFYAALVDLSPIQGDIAGALRAVRAKSAGARVVVISGSSEGPFDVPDATVSAWVRKPFEVSELLDALAPDPPFLGVPPSVKSRTTRKA